MVITDIIHIKQKEKTFSRNEGISIRAFPSLLLTIPDVMTSCRGSVQSFLNRGLSPVFGRVESKVGSGKEMIIMKKIRP